MNPEELSAIKAKRNAAIIAPAGHGKTEMIVDLVEAADQKVLIVTHTNAGIDALAKRFRKRGIDREKYSITTIAGFCIRWCNAYPFTGHIRNIPVTSKEYYPMQYKGTVLIFRNAWARDILKRTYGCVIVDEYQDCVLEQHQIFLEINKTLPVIVFGDPLQAIFGWAGNLVSWNNLSFEIVQVQTYPWRWHKTNPALGKGFCIGHSYFCTEPIEGQLEEDWYDTILKYEIKPLLQEYWWDDDNKAEEHFNIVKE